MTINKTEKNSHIQRLVKLKQDHRELDILIEELSQQYQINQFEISRLKKQKLTLKDAITRFESKLIPDLHA